MALRRGLQAFWVAYNTSLAERPLATKCATGIVGTILGDLIAQLSSHTLATTPAEGDAAVAAEPPRGLSALLRSSRGGGGGARGRSTTGGVGGGENEYEYDYNDANDGYTAGKDRESKERERPLLPRREGAAVGAGGGGGFLNGFKYDVGRVLRLCLWSLCVGTPIAHYWFRFLDTRVMPHAPTSNAAVVTKLLLDQLLMSPAGTALFFFGFRLLEGGSAAEARASVAAKWGPTMAMNYLLWPAANIINFKFVPPEQRILYVNVVALFWSAVMSHMANRKDPDTSAAGSSSNTTGGGLATAATNASIPPSKFAGPGGGAAYASAPVAAGGAALLSAGSMRTRGGSAALAAAAEPAGPHAAAGTSCPAGSSTRPALQYHPWGAAGSGGSGARDAAASASADGGAGAAPAAPAAAGSPVSYFARKAAGGGGGLLAMQ